jgi:hypothetical protein
MTCSKLFDNQSQFYLKRIFRLEDKKGFYLQHMKLLFLTTKAISISCSARNRKKLGEQHRLDYLKSVF